MVGKIMKINVHPSQGSKSTQARARRLEFGIEKIKHLELSCKVIFGFRLVVVHMQE